MIPFPTWMSSKPCKIKTSISLKPFPCANASRYVVVFRIVESSMFRSSMRIEDKTPLNIIV